MPKNNLARNQTIKKALINGPRFNKTYKKKNGKTSIDYELKHKEATTNSRRDFFKSLLTIKYGI